MNFIDYVKSGMTAIILILGLSIVTYGQEEHSDWDKAVSLYKQNQFQEAITEFKKFLQEYPTHAESWKFTGMAYFQLKEYASAVEYLEKALTLKRTEGKNDTDVLLALSRTYLGQKDYQKALPHLESLTKQQPDMGVNFYLLGIAYANEQRTADAIKALKTAIKLDAKDADSWYYLGAIQLQAQQVDDAINTFRSAVVALPRNIEITTLLSESLIRRALAEPDATKANSLYDEAIKTALKVKSLRDDAASSELLGRAYLAAKRYTSAELTLSRALILTKEPSATLYFNLGLAHAQNKSWNRAAEMLLRADRLNPANIDTLTYLGFVYENLRKYAQALDAYNRAYEASGRNNAEVLEAINRVTPLLTKQ